MSTNQDSTSRKHKGSRERGFHRGRLGIAGINNDGVQTIVIELVEDYRHDRNRRRIVRIECTPTQFANAIIGMGERPCVYKLPTVMEESVNGENENDEEVKKGRETDTMS